jgi:hypothetical protein
MSNFFMCLSVREGVWTLQNRSDYAMERSVTSAVAIAGAADLTWRKVCRKAGAVHAFDGDGA